MRRHVVPTSEAGSVSVWVCLGMLTLLSAVSARGQGTVIFANDINTPVLDGRVAGLQPAAAGQFMVGLYYTPNLSAVPEFFAANDEFNFNGPATPVLDGGRFVGGTRTLSGVPSGTTVLVQVRGWTVGHASYAEAFLAGSSGDTSVAIGQSVVMQLTLGGGVQPAPSILFHGMFPGMVIGVPEPSVWVLGLLGALGVAAKAWGRRKMAGGVGG